jgi:hypothetical protein
VSFTTVGLLLVVVGAMLWIATLELAGLMVMSYGFGFASAGYYVRRRML